MATRQSYSTRDQKNLKIVNLLDPTTAQDAATKAYVDTKVSGAALATTSPAAETSGATGAVGVGTTAARADHVHALPVIPALASTTPTAETSGVAGAVGVSTTVARADHVHALPVIPALASTTPVAVSVNNVGDIGTGTTAARADHVHGISTVTQYDQRAATSTTTNLSVNDEIVFVPTTISIVKLPAANSVSAGKMIIVKSLGNGVTVQSFGGVIDNGLSKSVNIEDWGSRSYVSDGTNWWAV